MRECVSYQLQHPGRFKNNLLLWGHRSEEVIWLDGNGHQDPYSSFDALLGVDAATFLSTDCQNAFQKLSAYKNRVADWLFGYFSYDLKNEIEDLSSSHVDNLDFPDLYFFQPRKIICVTGQVAEFRYMKEVAHEVWTDYQYIKSLHRGSPTVPPSVPDPVKIRLRIFKDAYYSKVGRLLHHIHRGDIYEANFCQEFYAEKTRIDPLRTFQKLNDISHAPFAAYLRLGDKYLLCASPERYLKRVGDRVVSQPIKGTAARSPSHSRDRDLKAALEKDPKERAENIMIVDLVRNDLSRSALKGSVTVKELCRVYTFEQVHQMISTIEATVNPGKDPVELIRETFPMGSMTGAPKISAMQLIEELEDSRRGLYSGAVGYFTPENDFDFNVVIRSILYNASKNYVSYSVGSAITARAHPEKEYEECLLKAKAMREVLEG